MEVGHDTIAIPAVLAAVAIWRVIRSVDAMDAKLELLLQSASAHARREPHILPPVESDSFDDSFTYVTKTDASVAASLADIRAEDWAYDRPIIKVDNECTVRVTLDTLHASGASCALVYDGDRLVGVVDTPDVLRHVLRASSSMAQAAANMVRQCVVATPHLTVADICAHMRTGTRYVVIARASGGHQLVSQRSLARAVLDHFHRDVGMRTALTETTTKDLPSFQRVIVLTHRRSAREAFEKMAAYGITSLPIVDDNGRACGVISATDVFYARHSSTHLEMNVLEFVSESRRDADNPRSADTVVTCRPGDDMVIALRTMLHHNVHHVYVVDSSVCPVGVVSFVDILRLI